MAEQHARNVTRARVRLISFGYLHAAPPDADLVLDARRYLRDPAAANGVLDLDGRDDRVQAVVLRTPGAAATVRTLAAFVREFPRQHDCVVAIGCAGGRHRSVALVELLAESLHDPDARPDVVHLHVHLPRVLTSGGQHG
ncbi:RNase adapter RapZ [Micromonospora sp. NPDC049662]|uniref:RapZ C-terminal domain-containing protein n=1 Tax=Micromonospora sp. NPDC049662 TaxID=3155397 RepID=UPI00342AEE3A